MRRHGSDRRRLFVLQKILRPVAQCSDTHYADQRRAGPGAAVAEIRRHEDADPTIPKGSKMKSNITRILLVASIGALSMAANAQYGAPPTAPDKATTAAPAMTATEKRMSESDIRLYREGRRACNKMTGAAQEDCRKQLASKYVDKQCRNLSGVKLDECIKAEYPGE